MRPGASASSSNRPGTSASEAPRPGTSQNNARQQQRAQTTPGGPRHQVGGASSSTTAARVSLNQRVFDGRMRSPFGMSQHTVFPTKQQSLSMHSPQSSWQSLHTRGGNSLENTVSLDRSLEPPGGRPNTTPGGMFGRRSASLTSIDGRGEFKRTQTNWVVLRVKLPTYLNTPERKDDTSECSPEEKYVMMRKIGDLELLLHACRRSGKLREEGRCCFSLAVLHDNMKEYGKGVKYYTDFLKICRDCDDKQGQALAYHSLAASHQVLGQTNSSGGGSSSSPTDEGHLNPSASSSSSSTTTATLGGLLDGTKTSVDHVVKEQAGGSSASSKGPKGSAEVQAAKDNEKIQHLKTALYFHNKHRKIADSVGKFIAHANLGLCYASLGEKNASTLNHQYALQFALQLQSVEGQSLAIGNLAVSSDDLAYNEDPEKMRALIERYIQLCDSLHHDNSSALKKLGSIYVRKERDLEKGIGYYQRALEVSAEAGDSKGQNSVLVSMGILTGFSQMDAFLKTRVRLAKTAARRGTPWWSAGTSIELPPTTTARAMTAPGGATRPGRVY
ncbi:unnamed protein product [Amoebophrya sp. A25]|nr:unnamed protein product [Amoebophrya sp. A25]|eukprot:GSA25T00007128001.1